MSRQPLATLQKMVHACIEEGQGLTGWEEQFVEDISEQLDLYGHVSEKQEEILNRIYSQKTP